MTSSILLRNLIRPSVNCQIASLIIRPCVLSHELLNNYQYQSVRCAGHAKWQNIKHTKQAGDMAKGKLHSKMVMAVKKAVVMGGMCGDPKLNGKLAQIMAEANKMNVPKAILERAIERAKNLEIRTSYIEIQGPGGASIIVKCETENLGVLRRDVKKAMRKFDAIILAQNAIMNMFGSRGCIRVETVNKDGKEIDQDLAEEAAIIANAETVYEETDISETGETSRQWVFITDADTLDPCRGELEKFGCKIINSDLELKPYKEINFGPDITEQVVDLCNAIREVDQVVDIYHNIQIPKEEAEALVAQKT